MANYVDPRAVKKFFRSVNPFARREPPPVSDEPLPEFKAGEHAHSFSCACTDCNDETARLTRERLKRQGG